MRIPNNVLVFAGNDISFFEKAEYIKSENGEDITFEMKEKKIHEALLKEICRHANIADFSAFKPEQYVSHPTLQWATFAVINSIIDLVIPDTITESIGMYAEVKNGGFGDSFQFDLKPRDLFVVSKAGHG